MESLFDPNPNMIRYFPDDMYYKRAWRGYELFDHEYDYQHYDDFIKEVADYLNSLQDLGYPLFLSANKTNYYNIPCSFDIETSSFRSPSDGTKAACMYIWQFGFNGSVIYGRTWDEFFEFLENFAQFLQLSKKLFIIIYVHNLAYEFQWIRRYFEWDKVFALKKRKVVRAVYANMGIEFRCSYLLANAGLAHVGDKLITKYRVKKMVGDLDYSLVRSSWTPLTPAELKYALNDVRVVMAFIQEKIENDGGITSIPLTNTGYVRNFCRNECMEDKHAAQKYHSLMNSLQIKDIEEYEQNKRAIMGGFTHAGLLHANQIVHLVGSADLISSYPAEMVGSYFPMSSAIYIGAPKTQEQFIDYLNSYCCIFDIEFYNLMPAVEYESYLSISRCVAEEFTLNNGRIVSAKYCLATLTELDFDIVNKLYTWTSMRITNLRIYTRGYLPRTIITAVLHLYSTKTKLKDIPEEVVEYLRSKNMVNAAFGMMLTDIIRPEYKIDEDDNWITEEAFREKQLNSYNKNFNRFLYYTWGIYVTAHARHNLFEAIMEFGNDYVYADTDSIKGVNFEKHLNFFTRYNFNNLVRMRKMCNCMEIDFEEVCPSTIKGEPKLLGNWEIERSYEYFKTCGAKRYMYIYPPDKKHPDGELSLTVAGLNKKYAIPYLLDNYDGDKMRILEKFQDGFMIPRGHSGKQTVTYIDEETQGYATDYLGNKFTYHEASSVHMEAQGFVMSQTDEYLDMLRGIEQDERR